MSWRVGKFLPEVNALQLEPTILWQDQDLVAVHKPAGLLSHPGADRSRPNLAEWMRGRFPEAEKLVMQHRLDKETSGILLWSCSQRACAPLAQAIAEHRMEKIYLAWVWGSLPREGLIDLRLAEQGGRVRPDPQGKPAETRFRRLRLVEGLSLVELKPNHGRKHQLRVHMAFSGWPIVGDPLYRGRPSSRLWLHAWKLRLEHPVSRQELALEAPLEEGWGPLNQRTFR